MHHLPIWFIGQIPVELCDKATEEFFRLPTMDATMGSAGENKSHKYRDTTVRFAEKNHWFGELLNGFALEANKACSWDFEITDHECLQFAEYGPEQHYNWHTDTFMLSGAPTDRKVTAVCLLNDPSEFVGGEFEMRFYSEYKAPLVKGSIIAFPSLIEHRVVPIIGGKRMSATIWLNGPRFR